MLSPACGVYVCIHIDILGMHQTLLAKATYNKYILSKVRETTIYRGTVRMFIETRAKQ